MFRYSYSDELKILRQLDGLEKKSQGHTAPYYIGECPESKKKIKFTPSTLVQNKGKVDCPEGPRKPKKIKPVSLADKILKRKVKRKKKSSLEYLSKTNFQRSRLRTIMSSALVEFAKEELERAGLFDKDSDYDGMLADAIMELVEAFASQGHSGGSSSMILEILPKLLNYETLTDCPHNKTHILDGVDDPKNVVETCDHCHQLWFDGEKFDMESIKSQLDGIKKYACIECYEEGARKGMTSREVKQLYNKKHPKERKMPHWYKEDLKDIMRELHNINTKGIPEEEIREMFHPKYDYRYQGYVDFNDASQTNMSPHVNDIRQTVETL